MKRTSIYARTGQAKARQLAWERDHGVCHSCGVDTVMVEAAYRAALQSIGPDPAHRGGWGEATRILAGMREVKRRFEALGFHPGKAMWDVEHRTPVDDGGTNDPSNLITLCTPCHARSTRDYAGQRSRRPGKRIGRL